MKRYFLFFLVFCLYISLVSGQVSTSDDYFNKKSSIDVRDGITANKVVDKRVFDFVSDKSSIRMFSSQDVRWDSNSKFSVDKAGFQTFTFPEGYSVFGTYICDKSDYNFDKNDNKVFMNCWYYKSPTKTIEVRNETETVFLLNITKVSDTQLTIHHGAFLDPIISNYTDNLSIWGGQIAGDHIEMFFPMTGNANDHSGNDYTATLKTNATITDNMLYLRGDLSSNSRLEMWRGTTGNDWNLPSQLCIIWDVVDYNYSDGRFFHVSDGTDTLEAKTNANKIYVVHRDSGFTYHTHTGSKTLPYPGNYTYALSIDVSGSGRIVGWLNNTIDFNDSAYSGWADASDQSLYVPRANEAGIGYFDNFIVYHQECTQDMLDHWMDLADAGCEPNWTNTSCNPTTIQDNTSNCSILYNCSYQEYDQNECESNKTHWNYTWGYFAVCTDPNDYCGAGCQMCDGSGGCSDCDDECQAANCYTGQCSDDSCVLYNNTDEGNCDVCEYCNGASGTCQAYDNVWDNIGDEIWNDTNGSCVICSAGVASYQTGNEDIYDKCPIVCYGNSSYSANGFCDGVTGSCNTTMAECPVCEYCNESNNESCKPMANHSRDMWGTLNLCNNTCMECYLDAPESIYCQAQNSGQDKWDDCPLVQCDGDALSPWYYGWDALVCFYRSDTDGYCDGAGECVFNSTVCNDSNVKDGSTGIECNCTDACEGCYNITAPTCNDTVCANCTPTWQANYTPCNYSDKRIKTYYDSSDCNVSAGIPGDNNTEVSCDYCSMDAHTYKNTTYTNYSNGTCGYRWKSQFMKDFNFAVCCNLTNISADCYLNDTMYHNYSYVLNNSEYLACTSTSCATIEDIRGEFTMIGIILFILVVNVALFVLPFVKPEFYHSDNKELNKLVNLIIRRGTWVIAVYLAMLNSTIVATAASEASLPVTNELFTYMWLFGALGYVLMAVLVFSTFIEVLNLWRVYALNKRLGSYDG